MLCNSNRDDAKQQIAFIKTFKMSPFLSPRTILSAFQNRQQTDESGIRSRVQVESPSFERSTVDHMNVLAMTRSVIDADAADRSDKQHWCVTPLNQINMMEG